MTPARLVVYVVLLTAAGLAARRPATLHTAHMPSLARDFGAWHAADDAAVDAEDAAQLGADAYVSRTYVGGAPTPVGLYAAYYAAPEAGSTWHSPLNCLPGTGWEAEDIATIEVVAPGGRDGAIRRVVVQKGTDRVVVLYWYQIHGRMVASEALGKMYLLADSLRLGRSDAWFVRIAVAAAGTVESAEQVAHQFTRDALPALAKLWS
jgi:EpsI family protein